MQSYQFIKTFFLSFISLLLFVASLNFFMDPNWTFSHSHALNNIQKASNERIQKSNVLYFRESNYDALLLGSSRVTFFNQYDFKSLKTYNYAVSLAMPQEYEAYIDFAKKQNKKDFNTIYIGVDFYGSNKNMQSQTNAKEIFYDIQTCCYRYKLLFSIDSLKTTLQSLKMALKNDPGYRSYKRNNITMSAPRDKESVRKDVESKTVKEYMGNIHEYQFNVKLKETLMSLKKKNPHTKFVIFTTPTSDVYLKKLFELGHKEAYKQWLTLLVDVFGEVYHFMDFNTVTKNYSDYYIDYHHLFPRYTSWIVDRLQKRENSNIPKDFGILLNNKNIESYLKNI